MVHIEPLSAQKVSGIAEILCANLSEARSPSTSRRRNLIGMSLVRFAEAQTFARVPLPLPQIRASILKIPSLSVLRLVRLGPLAMPVLGPFAFLLVALKFK